MKPFVNVLLATCPIFHVCGPITNVQVRVEQESLWTMLPIGDAIGTLIEVAEIVWVNI